MLTLEEMERRAYISGDTERAELFARLEDATEESEEANLLTSQADEAAADERAITAALRKQIRKLGEVPCA